MSQAAQNKMTMLKRQGQISLLLAASIMGGWLIAHVYAVFFFEITARSLFLVPVFIALLSWLSVGLFIVAHDCMHGSLVPFKPEINRRIGKLALWLYAGFDFDKLNPKHHLHHRHAGTADDPDFHDKEPHAFWPWYFNFFLEYFTLREYAIISGIFLTYWLAIGAELPNILLFWALPAILSSLQLFYFGTYEPHKPGTPEFIDRHRTRTSRYSYMLSLLTCFHFGYHHEHHDQPNLPWWKLPHAHKTTPVTAGVAVSAS